MTAVAKTLSFLKVAGALYQVLELACRDYTKNAIGFSSRMSLFDLHLGTELQSVFLMRELFRNRKMLLALREEDVVRYTHMLATHRKAAFALLLRSVKLSCIYAYILLRPVVIMWYAHCVLCAHAYNQHVCMQLDT